MRALYVVVTSLVFAALMVLGLFWIGDPGSSSNWRFWLGTAAIFLLTFPAIALGAFLQWWPLEPRRAEGRKYLLRMLVILTGLQVIGAVLAFVVSSAGGAMAWRPLAYVALVALLTVGSFFLARVVRRRDDLRPPAPSEVWDPPTVRRKTRTVAIWFVVGLIAGVIADIALSSAEGEDFGADLVRFSPFAFTLACFAGAIACIAIAWPLVRQIREVKGSYFSEFRAITRVVIKGKKEELSGQARARAVRYARTISTYYPFQMAYFTLLYLGILSQQATQVVNATDERRALAVGLCIGLVVVYIVMLPILLRQRRRARRYAADHADELVPAS